MLRKWQTSQRTFEYGDKTLVMAILNVTPDSFSDGGKFESLENALRQAEKHIEEGADILDIGGESTRPKSERVDVSDELGRVIPIISAIKKRFQKIAVSVDTTKSEVAEKAIEAGAEIINDVSGLRFDTRIATVSAKYKTGLILMHSRGEFSKIHSPDPDANIMKEVSDGFRKSINEAKKSGVKDEQLCLDIGIGFSKTFAQNLELIAGLKTLCREFENHPMMVGLSRKSFLGKIVDDLPVDRRLNASLSANAISVWNGAHVVRVHDVKPTVEAIKVVDQIAKHQKG